jgi:two-component system, response regulator
MPDQPVEILLVEDSLDDAELAIRALRKYNLANNLHHVEDGEEALKFFYGPNPPRVMPKLIMLDLKLPKLSGLEVLARLRASDPTRIIPIVILTSSKEDSDLAEAYRLGANSYIVKPVDFKQFMEAVGNLGVYWIRLNEQSK